MAERCTAIQYWDALVKNCLPCDVACKLQPVISKCTKFCAISRCNTQTGHYYDGLLKKCMKCADVCGGSPVQCPQQCLTPAPPAITRRTSTKSAPQTPASTGLSVVTVLDSNILVYSLLALSVVLLLSSLGLALRVFLSEAKSSSSKTKPKRAHTGPSCQDPLNKEFDRLQTIPEEMQLRQPAERELSDNSSPTETCVCVHCFPDLKGLGQDSPIRASYSNQQAVLQRVPGLNGGSVWTEQDIYTSGTNAQEEVFVA